MIVLVATLAAWGARTPRSALAIVPQAAIGFQDEGTTNLNVLAGISAIDDVWSPADITPVGTVDRDYYATGTSERYLDAVSLEFDAAGWDFTKLVLRVYLQKGNYDAHGGDIAWEHYQLLPGLFNPTNEDINPITQGGPEVLDHLPDGTLPANEVVGWVDFVFDATTDPMYVLPNGNIGLTLRLWNWRVDAIELVPGPASSVVASQSADASKLVNIDYTLHSSGKTRAVIAKTDSARKPERRRPKMRRNTGRKAILAAAMALPSFGALAAATADLDDGLVGYWSFDDCTAYDASGHNHHGVLNGDPQIVDGVAGLALRFDGSDDHIVIQDDAAFQLLDWSLCCWMRLDVGHGSVCPCIAKQHDAYSKYNFFLLAAETNGHTYARAQYETCDDESDHTLGLGIHGALLEDGVWYFLASTRDSETGRHALYVNGACVHESIWYDMPCDNSEPVRIAIDPTSAACLKGTCDEVCVYDRALDESEIRLLYQANASVFTVAASQQPDAGKLVDVTYQLGEGGRAKRGGVGLARRDDHPEGRYSGMICTMPNIMLAAALAIPVIGDTYERQPSLVTRYRAHTWGGVTRGHGVAVNEGRSSAPVFEFTGPAHIGDQHFAGCIPEDPDGTGLVLNFDLPRNAGSYSLSFEAAQVRGGSYDNLVIVNGIMAGAPPSSPADDCQIYDSFFLEEIGPLLVTGANEIIVQCGRLAGNYDDLWIRNLTVVPGALANVVANQRDDASRLLDTDYGLRGNGDSRTITLQVSSDGGETWDIVPTAAWGDIGEGVVPGEEKHIVWNPAIDIPGISGDEFMVRVIADDVYCADSNVFSIVAAGPGDVQGTVTDYTNNDPVVGAEVTINGGEPVITDEQGFFAFTDVPAGEATVHVSHPGYCNLTRWLEVREDSYTEANLLLNVDTGFGVADIQSWYLGPGQHVYFLDGIDLDQTFTATLRWALHDEGEVHWITPKGTYVDECEPGTDTVSRTFNVGTEFGAGGKLRVKLVSAEGAESSPYYASFDVVPKPDGLVNAPLFVEFSTSHLRYKSPTLRAGGPMETGSGVGDGVIPDEIPGVGGKALSFVSIMNAEVEVTGDGRARTTVSLHPPKGAEGKTKMAGISIMPHVDGNLRWRYEDGAWQSGGDILLGVDVTASVPPAPVYFPIGPCPICVPGYWRVLIEVGVAHGLEVIGWAGPGEPWLAGLTVLDPFPYIEGNLGAGAADILAIEGYVGGGTRMKLRYPVFAPVELEELKVFLAGGVRFVALIFEYDLPIATCSYDLATGEGGCTWGGGAKAGGEPVLRLIRRDYLDRDGGYAVWVANDRWRAQGRDMVTTEAPLQENVFSQSTAHLAAIGNDLILVWVYDDPIRTPTNRTEIVFASGIHNGGDPLPWVWDDPAAVADDGTADFHPHVDTWNDGTALVAWENASEVLIEPGEPADPCLTTCETECTDPQSPECLQCLNECKYDELKSKTEIAVAHFDGVAWGAQTIMTDNTWLDRSPRVATAADGTAMLTWVSNAANDELGDASHPNDIHYALYNGVEWSTPGDLALDVPSIIKSALAYRGDEAILLFTGDTDGDNATPDDRELFAIEYDGAVWGPVLQLTDDVEEQLEDANPRVAYDVTGEPVIVWYRGGDVYFATDLALTDPQVAVDMEGASSGTADFRLATGPAGQIALVWQEASDDVVDMWYALYMTAVDAWTQPRRLTADRPMEHAVAPVIDADGDLVAAYNKVQIAYETREVEVGGEIVVVDNVPAFDQSDLYLLWHTVSGELGITDGDISIDPANPVPGSEATITATVRNLGDTPAENIEVAFYDGDPDGGGTLIDMPAIVGPVGGGQTAEISVPWLVPASTDPRTLYVVVDPAGLQEDGNPDNNETSLTILAPDLTISSINVQAAGNDRIITMRVQNAGALTVVDAAVDLRRDAADGELLAALSVTEPLVPGAFRDMVWVWEDIAPIVGGEIEIFAIADPTDALSEFDEDNNIRSTLVTNMPAPHPGDWDEDGDVDLDDFAEFPGCMSGPWDLVDWAMPSAECRGVFDFDGDADVDLRDFAAFQVLFGGQ